MNDPGFVGSVHNHTVSSNYAPVSPLRALKLAAGEGFHFFALTDHDRRVHELPWSREEWLRAERFPACRLLRGFEASFPGAHVNCLGLLPGDLQDVPVDRTWFAAVRRRGGLCFLNHPSRWNNDPAAVERLGPVEELDGLEIYSGARRGKPEVNDADAALALTLWDALLTRGHRLWGLASSDCHSYDPDNPDYFTNGYIVARAPSPDPAHLYRALREGRFYASTGMRIAEWEVTDSHLAVAAPTVAEFRFLGNGGQTLQVSRGTHASYRFTGDEIYVRCEVTDDASRPGAPLPPTAWLQPVFPPFPGGS